MSKLTRRDTAAATLVRHLSPESLHQLIRARGLDACGELVTSATPAQLTSVLDLDLWRPARPGRDQQFDVDRFGEWLEVLVDAGDSLAARTVAAVDKDLVIAGLSRYVRVFDPGIFEPTAQTDDESIDRYDAMREGDYSSGDRLECEVAGYVIRARRIDAWDAIITLLVALDAAHNDYFHAVMQGCRLLSNSRPEIDGLDDLLLEPEQHLHEVALEREHRQSQQGYATPADARAFLEMARQRKQARPEEPIATNPIVAAYFRALDGEPGSRSALLRPAEHGRAFTPDRELAFLANTLLAGCSVQSRPFTPREAADAAAAICNLGLDYRPVDSPRDHDLIAAFEVGWSVLHHDVSLFAADQLVSTLTDVDRFDREIRLELVALRRTLVKQRDAGTPWRARGAAEILAMLDMTAWVGVLGLLDECPVLPAALIAVVEGRIEAVSPAAFDFISSAAQIDHVRTFMRMLPDVLSG